MTTLGGAIWKKERVSISVCIQHLYESTWKRQEHKLYLPILCLYLLSSPQRILNICWAEPRFKHQTISESLVMEQHTHTPQFLGAAQRRFSQHIAPFDFVAHYILQKRCPERLHAETWQCLQGGGQCVCVCGKAKQSYPPSTFLWQTKWWKKPGMALRTERDSMRFSRRQRRPFDKP